MTSSLADSSRGFRIFTYSFLIIGAFLCVFPLLLSFSYSLMNLTEVTSKAWLPSVPQWQNYSEAWDDGKFDLYFWNSVRIAAITIVGQLIFTILAGYAFARMEFPGKNFLFGLMLATLVLPEAILWVPCLLYTSDAADE